MKGFNKLKIASAASNKSRFDLSTSTLTTFNFGQIVPILCSEMIPGDTFTVKENVFSRLAPMPVPTYGKADFRTVTMFVPYRTLGDDLEAFFAGDKYYYGKAVTNRTITQDALGGYLRYSQYGLLTTKASVSEGEHYDVTWRNDSGNIIYGKWTAKGKWVYKILRQLGYSFPSGIDTSAQGTDWNLTYKNVELSALPLLSLAKAYNDHMSQSVRFNVSELSKCLEEIKTKASGSLYVSTNGRLNISALEVIFNSLNLMYDSDYITSAWRHPDMPLGNNEGVGTYAGNVSADSPSLGLLGVESKGNTITIPVGSDANSTEYAPAIKLGTINNPITQRSLNMLQAFDNWFRRNNYSGARSVERILSRFGIKPEDYRSQYAQIVNTSSSPIQIGDVTNTTASSDESMALGTYAGKGIISGNDGYTFKASDFGMLITLGYIAVRPLYPYGMDKHVLRTKIQDYYQPEYDGLGAEPISQAEVQMPLAEGMYTAGAFIKDIYGFTERYNSYKTPIRDKVTGDFEYFPDMQSWHFGRRMQDYPLLAQSSDVVAYNPVENQWNRIFVDMNDDIDHFYVTCYFDINAVRPMKTISSALNLGTGEVDIQRNGAQLS